MALWYAALGAAHNLPEGPSSTIAVRLLEAHKPEQDPEYTEERLLCPACSSWYSKGDCWMEVVDAPCGVLEDTAATLDVPAG